MTSHAPIQKKPAKQAKGRSIKLLPAVLAGLLLFVLGINIGNGRIDFRASTPQSAELPSDLDYASVENLYDKLRSNYDGELNEEALLDGLKEGLANASGDAYTEYFNFKDATEFNQELTGSFTGIGAELGKNDGGSIEVISPIAGFPAEKAGLKAKDIIVKINDESALDLSVSDAVSKIRGEAGTNVKITVIRNQKDELTFDITRAQITIPSVKSEVVDGVGVLTISRYGPDTAQLAREAAESFKSQDVRGVVLDVRGNPGGLLDAAVDVSSLWLDANQTVLQEKQDGVVTRTFKAKGTPILKGVKTAVLINEGSASASEITAGALADNKVATLIGTKSYGKGSVQQLINLADGGLLKVTSARWFTPNGTGIDKAGIEPAQKVERSDDDIKAGRDPQKDAALNFVKL